MELPGTQEGKLGKSYYIALYPIGVGLTQKYLRCLAACSVWRGLRLCVGNAPGRSVVFPSHIDEVVGGERRLDGTKTTHHLPSYHRVRGADVQLIRVSVDAEFGFRC